MNQYFNQVVEDLILRVHLLSFNLFVFDAIHVIFLVEVLKFLVLDYTFVRFINFIEQVPDHIVLKTKIKEVTEVNMEVTKGEETYVGSVKLLESFLYWHSSSDLALNTAKHFHLLDFCFHLTFDLLRSIRNIVRQYHLNLRNLDC